MNVDYASLNMAAAWLEDGKSCCAVDILFSAFSNSLVPVYRQPFKRIINYLYAMNLETTEVSLTAEEKKQLEEYDR